MTINEDKLSKLGDDLAVIEADLYDVSEAETIGSLHTLVDNINMLIRKSRELK